MELTGKEYYDLGFDYFDHANYEKAVECFNKAIELNEPAGYNGLGFCYKLGNGVEKDPGLAYKWCMKSGLGVF